MKKVFLGLLLLFSLILGGCVLTVESITITNGDSLTINLGESVQLGVTKTTGIVEPIKWLVTGDSVTIDENGLVYASKVGISSVIASTTYYSDIIQIQVVNGSNDNDKGDDNLDDEKVTINLVALQERLTVGSTMLIDAIVIPENRKNEVVYNIVSGSEYASLNGNILSAKQVGTVIINAYIDNVVSNTLEITIEELLSDPYENMSKQEFYSNYQEATSYMDAYYRSLHGFMSGSIEDQDDEPTISIYQPKENGIYLKNSYTYYSADGNAYLVLDANGEVVKTIYKGGGYVTLEDVAAYVFAFGDIPANYTSSKKGSPSTSIWGEYLRLNNSKFSGDTSRYPYEPELPNISGCGGELVYYEIDLGTTGTDTGGGYDVAVYNDGYSITRGAARIVYSRYDKNGDQIIDINEKFVFYTYNHYNDFQEYLNYEGGWGEMFGNITGGGKLSSKTNYNPTPYVQTILKDFSKGITKLSEEMEVVNQLPAIYINYKKEQEFVW